MKHIRTLVTLLLAFMMAFALCVTPATAESTRTDLNVNLWAEPLRCVQALPQALR